MYKNGKSHYNIESCSFWTGYSGRYHVDGFADHPYEPAEQSEITVFVWESDGK